MPDLIRLIHGNSIGVSRIVKTFRMHWGAKKVAPPPSVETTPTDLSCTTSPKTPTVRMDSCRLENASKISKRQLEKKIHEIAVKESRSPGYKPVWYVHNEILAKHNMDPDNMTPFSSPSMPAGPAMITTPTTPHSALADKKHAVNGTRTLFDMLRKSPHATTPPPQPKRIKLQLHVDKPRNLGNDDPPSTSQKRDLDNPGESPAKRLCLEDTTNKTGKQNDLMATPEQLSLAVAQ